MIIVTIHEVYLVARFIQSLGYIQAGEASAKNYYTWELRHEYMKLTESGRPVLYHSVMVRLSHTSVLAGNCSTSDILWVAIITAVPWRATE